MTVEELIRDFIDTNLEHVDLADVRRGPIVALDTTDGSPRRLVVAATAIAATVVVVGGLVALGNSRTDDFIASTTPQTAPTQTPTTPVETVSTDVASLPAPTTTDAPTSTAAPTLPVSSDALFDLFDRLYSAHAIAFVALDHEIQECMNLKGFDDVPTPMFLGADFHPSSDDLVWRFPTDERAATTGYARASTSTPITVGEPPEGSQEFAALYGNIVGSWSNPDVPAGFAAEGDIYDGCLPTAQTRIVGNGDPALSWRINDYIIELQGVLNPAINVVTTAPEFVAAQEVWIGCMNDAGFDVTAPSDPIAGHWADPRPSPAETAMATTDASCKDSSGVRAIGDRIFNEQVASWFEAHPDEPQKILDFISGLVVRSAGAPASN
jgi:hypothetical protein